MKFVSVNDDDGDEVRCRWSEAAKRECAGVCDAFPGAVLDQVKIETFAKGLIRPHI